MSTEPTPPTYSPPPSKPPSWTAGKVAAVVLIVIVAASIAAAGAYYSRPGATGTSILTCSNGATNYPSCNSCAAGEILTGGSCQNNCANGATNPPTCNNNVCTNGATNPPSCSSYPSCTNGANNPPYCNQYPPCGNGATNPPNCTTFRTEVSMACQADGGGYHGNVGMGDGPFGGWCTAILSGGPSVPTGTVGWSCSESCVTGTPNACCGAPPLYSTTCTLVAFSSIASDCGNRAAPSWPINGYNSTFTIYANYEGDNTHLSNSNSFTFTAPKDVSLSVNAVYQPGCIGCSVTSIGFVSSTGQVYSASCPQGLNYCSTITLPNLSSYTVKVYYSGNFGSGACRPTFYMNIYQFSSNAVGNFDCF